MGILILSADGNMSIQDIRSFLWYTFVLSLVPPHLTSLPVFWYMGSFGFSLPPSISACLTMPFLYGPNLISIFLALFSFQLGDIFKFSTSSQRSRCTVVQWKMKCNIGRGWMKTSSVWWGQSSRTTGIYPHLLVSGNSCHNLKAIDVIATYITSHFASPLILISSH